MIFHFQDRSFDFSKTRWVVFGILNITPDSFSDGGKFTDVDQAVDHALQLEEDGADAIDIGGESSRPAATPVSVEEELLRVIPVIRELRKHTLIPISIDTTKSKVAEAALKEGANIVNDISGLQFDPDMSKTVRTTRAGLILMHSRGTPQTMQTLCQYNDVALEVKKEILQRYTFAITQQISPSSIAWDIGIGFAKTRDQNLDLLRQLRSFTDERPLMVGVSRKSFLGGMMEERKIPTLTSEIWCALQGAHMIRTHEVAPLRQALNTLASIHKTGSG